MLSLIRDLGTGKIKGYGIFEYDNPNDVDLAIVALNGFVCGQNVIRVQKLGAMPNSMTQKIVKNPVLAMQVKQGREDVMDDQDYDDITAEVHAEADVKNGDYANGSTVPLNRLTTFYFLVEGKGSKLKGLVQKMIVATSDGTQLPKLWDMSGATQRKYSAEEIEAWRKMAQQASSAPERPTDLNRKQLKRWPHQRECLKHCREFLQNTTKMAKRDFFVQMATGTGKSLVMADLLAGISAPKRACVIVPKLDLMEQMAQLLQELFPSSQISRVGTGWPANLSADIFVCVRNSAWQLANLTFDLVLFDEGHHYEPVSTMSGGIARDGQAENLSFDASQPANDVDLVGMTHAQQVLALQAKKRIFFTATLRMNLPDFDFGLRPAIEAGVIQDMEGGWLAQNQHEYLRPGPLQDYSVMVPVLSEGDPRPGLVELIRNLPLSRKILAFCNTVHEAQAFARMLSEAGIAAGHYNGRTGSVKRLDILKSFERPELHGGIRVLVTVDVLSEGVDLPIADSCMFVAPRQGARLRQCVGRVLRKHHAKVDALVIAPPIVRRENGFLTEEAELSRLLSELATADPWFEQSLQTGKRRLSVCAAGIRVDNQEDVLEKAARVLRIHVLPYVLDACHAQCLSAVVWKIHIRQLAAYLTKHGDCLVPQNYTCADGFRLGAWVSVQRFARAKGKLAEDRITELEKLGFVWDVDEFAWDSAMGRLKEYKAEYSDAMVPRAYTCADGFRLGFWVSAQRKARAKGKLGTERITELDKLGFAWDAKQFVWDSMVERLQAYKAKYSDALVPVNYISADGFKLGFWVSNQRQARAQGRLAEERITELEKLGFVWDVIDFAWDSAMGRLKEYKAEYSDSLVPRTYTCTDGFRLGFWVSSQRKARAKGKLAEDRITELGKLGFVWDASQFLWHSAIGRLKAYKAQYSNALVPVNYTCADGFGLGVWVRSQRFARAKGKLGTERITELDKLGFAWDAKQFVWDSMVERLQAYKAKYSDALVPVNYISADGFKLGFWVSNQRQARAQGKLAEDRITELEKLGFVWDVDEFAWDSAMGRLKEYKAEYSDAMVPRAYTCADGFRLGFWVSAQRFAKAKGKLGTERIRELDKLGFVWDVNQHAWDAAIGRWKAYKAEYSQALVPVNYTCADGFRLGVWVSAQRFARSKGKLAKERIAELDKLGFV
eukprot:Skav228815  [mRNA]  locus=scaffold359:323640:330797:+ [translate_table: standard]